MDLKRKWNLLQIKAFTLAEVLITLGIIGIIAEITIPALILSTQRQEFAILAQKNYSNVQNMLKMYMVDQGTGSLGLTNLFAGAFTDTIVQDEMENMVHKYFKVIKTCRMDTSDYSCAITEKYFGTAKPYTYPNSTSRYYTFITADGTEIFILMTDTCSPDFTKPGKMKALCGACMFDVNGAKGPNTFGKDFFASFGIDYDGTLYPVYGNEFAIRQNNTNSYWKNKATVCGDATAYPDMSSVSGIGCAARLMENGWKIDYW